MKKILFLIHDLHQGGAEKVLVNLVNNMDHSKFDITVMALFGGGVNEQFLAKNIKLIVCHKKPFPGNSHIMKLFTPKQLYRYYIKEHYDIIVSYLEGPAARIVSGCTDKASKLVSWIHVQQKDMDTLAAAFRNENDARKCYARFDQTICVSEYVQQDFCGILGFDGPCCVLYNTVESEMIKRNSSESAPNLKADGRTRLVAVGTLKEVKGYMRLLRTIKRLIDEAYPVSLYVLGSGPLQSEMERFISDNHLTKYVSLLGYDTNPYKYVSKCDLFVCASHSEGFSTAATEALIVGTPVCTVEVSGMKEMLGENNEWGVVTENDEEALYRGIKSLLDDPALLAHYKEQAAARGKTFSTENTVNAVQDMLRNL